MKTVLKYEVTYVVYHDAPLSKLNIEGLRTLPAEMISGSNVGTFRAVQTKVSLKHGKKVTP